MYKAVLTEASEIMCGNLLQKFIWELLKRNQTSEILQRQLREL
jgi:hypothetical protein